MKKMSKLWAFLCVTVMISGLFAPCASAAEAAYQRENAKIVRVAMLQYPNFIDLDESGNPTGFSCDYLNEISKYTGWVYDYVSVSFAEAQKMLENGEIDIVTGTQYTAERAEKYDYGETAMATDANVLCVPASDTSYYYNDFEALEGMTIGVMTESIRKQQFSDALAEKNVSVNFVEFDTDEQEKAALREGGVKAILMTSLRCTSDYRIIASTNSTNVYFTCNPHDASIKAGIDEAQSEILSFDPYFSMRLYEKYYDSVPRAYAFSDTERKYLAEGQTLTVAISSDMKPTEYYDEETDSFHGMVVDYFERISHITGLKFRYVIRGDKESTVQALNNGSIQLIASVAENGNVEDAYPITLTNSYYLSSVSMVFRDSVNDPLNKDCKVVLKSGFVYYQNLAKLQGYTNITYCNTLEECAAAVDAGQADLTYLPGYGASRLTGHAYYKHIKLFTSAVSEYKCGIGVSAQCEPVLVSILDKALAAIPATEQDSLLLKAIADNSDAKTWRDLLYENMNSILCGVIALCLAIVLAVMIASSRRKKTNRQLAAAMETAQRANAAKSDFLSRMSHDMRTPMNGIIGLTALTADIPELPKEAKENLAAIDDSSRYLMNLINDVLDMNKIESAKLTLNEEIIPSNSFIKNIIASVEPVARQKEIALEYAPMHLQAEYVKGDRVRLQQIFVNILSNAIKFTPEGGKIRIEVECLHQETTRADLRICIADSGVGMSEEYLPHLFEPFSQERRTAELNFAGTGLGMSIVKNLVELMGGRIEVRSKLNEGTAITVYLTLICVESENPQPDAVDCTEKISLSGKRVLLVEDHPLNIRIAVKLLEKKGIITECADNGQVGVAMFEQSPPGYYDAILMDIRMPVMNGIEATKAIRESMHLDAKTIPILAMTANAFDDDVHTSLKAGMNEHLTKPIDPATLYQMLSKYIGQRK